MRKSLFRFTNLLPDNSVYSVEEWLTFPMNLTIDQCYDQLTCVHHIPISCLKEFRRKLCEFIEKEQSEDHNLNYRTWLEKLRTSTVDTKYNCSLAEVQLEDDISSCAPDKLFMESYGNILHSSAATELMNLERSLASVIFNEVKQRDDTIRPIDNDLCELIRKLSLGDGRISPGSITLLQKDYCMFREAVQTKSDQCIEDMKQDQKREFNKFILSLNRKINSERNDSKNLTEEDRVQIAEHDIAERLNNALSLYSNTLHGFVILVDRNFSLHSDIKQALTRACERSTEFHFPDLKSQLNSIRKTMACFNQHNSNNQTAELNLKNQPIINPVKHSNLSDTRPNHGDVYITKHSNLVGNIAEINVGGGIHVIFHVVVDPSQQDNIRAPSALHCALSAILRTCFDYDITSLTLPLLFVPTVLKSMDITWREKRAETVLKAIKGALIELITWRGPSLKSIQFLLPSTLPDNELQSFSQIVTTSFLQPNPLIGTG